MKFLTTLVVLLAACGSGGSGGGGGAPAPADPPPVEPKDPLSLRTAVGLDPMAYRLKGLTACLSREQTTALPKAPAGFALDGDLGEWSGTPGLANDPAADADPALDLTFVSLAASGEDLALALAPLAPDAELYVEIGGVASQDGALTQTVRRVFRVKNALLEDFVGGAGGSFQGVAADLGRVATAAAGTELLLTRRLLGDSVTYPLWWARAFTRDDAGTRAGDSTGAQYFPSMLGTDDPPFVLATCHEWMGRRLPIDLVQIRDARGADKEALERTSERVFELTRMAYDMSLGLMGAKAFPTGRAVALATFRPTAPLQDATGFGATSDAGADGYRGFLYDARHVALDAVESFPQGALVLTVASRVIDTALRQAFPAADGALVAAWREALLDHATREVLGTSYWLDTYPDAVRPALAAVAHVDGTPAAPESSLGFGRLLAQWLSADQLMNAWYAAAAAGGDATTALKTSAAATQKDQRAVAVANLWSGWLTAGAFDPLAAPASLGDTDFDGVPDAVERQNGTIVDRADSDDDGWSDLAELVAGTDARVSVKTPNTIMPDGNFGDWQQLLPKRLLVDRGTTGRCPKAADVNFFAAIATRDAVIVGAVAAEYWENEPSARWEAEFDLPKRNEQRLVTGVSGERSYVVRDAEHPERIIRSYVRAAPVARRTIEWAIDREALGLETYFDVEDAVRIRLRTIFTADGHEIVCDETDWFKPSISGPEDAE